MGNSESVPQQPQSRGVFPTLKFAVTSNKDLKMNAVRQVFGTANVKGFKTQAPMADQPIDTKQFRTGLLGAVLRITTGRT